MKHWRTTLAGFIGFLLLIEPPIQAALAGKPVDWRAVAGAVVAALGGMVAKDAAVQA